MDKNGLYIDQETGRQAQVLVDQIEPYFKLIEDNLIEQFKACPLRDEVGLLTIRLHFTVLSSLRTNILSVVTTGKMANQRLAELEKTHV